MSAADAWLDRNTFRCALGRVTPAQCGANRSKAGWLEPRRRAPGGLRWESKRPSKCEGCVEHERLIREFRDRQQETEKPMSKKMILCPKCNDGKERPLGGLGLCRKHYMQEYCRRKKAQRAGTIVADPGKDGVTGEVVEWKLEERPVPGATGPPPPFDPTFARIGPALGSAGGGQLTLHFEGDDEQLLAWLDRDRMTSRRQTIEDHVLHILDTWRAMRERINMEEAQFRMGAARGGQT